MIAKTMSTTHYDITMGVYCDIIPFPHCQLTHFMNGAIMWNILLALMRLLLHFADLSQTHYRGLIGIVIKLKGKTGKKVHENTKFVEKLSIFEKLLSFS